MSDPFITNTMNLTDSGGNPRASNLLCQLDTANIPWNMEVTGLIPTDWYDLYSIGWSSPVPNRGDYFVDVATGTKYSMFSEVYIGPDTIQVRVTKYSGVTP